ncbi:hypothetical protein sos41_23000 [Alphaproteobacteria bacterium SO-S41]|nr:hypothetical protein sos41_23000 [Alphaproteobacteria bacterium SO-S41]
MKMQMLMAAALLAAGSTVAAEKPAHHCAADAVDKATKLLRFHLEEDPTTPKLTPKPNEPAADGAADGEWYVESEATLNASTENVDDLVVNGGLGKVPFVMHFFYVNSPDLCDLVGQSIMNE